MNTKAETPTITPDEDSIDLKELIQHLWRERMMISLVLVVTILLSAIYTWVLVEPSYEATTTILFKKPQTITTVYGDYVFPTQNIADYSQLVTSNDLIFDVIALGKYDLTEDQLRSKLSIVTTNDSNILQITVQNQDPEAALALNQDLVSLYLQKVQLVFQKNALDHFASSIETKQTILQEQIAKQESVLASQSEILAELEPTYTLRKILLSDPVAAAAFAEQNAIPVESLSKNIVEEEYLIDSYNLQQLKITETENSLIGLRQDLINQQNKSASIRKDLDAYWEKNGTPKQSELLGGNLDLLSTHFVIVSQPVLPEKPVSPSPIRNLAIGVLIGLMLGFAAAIVKKWWQGSSQIH